MIFCITVRLAVLYFLLYTTVALNTKTEFKLNQIFHLTCLQSKIAKSKFESTQMVCNGYMKAQNAGQVDCIDCMMRLKRIRLLQNNVLIQ